MKKIYFALILLIIVYTTHAQNVPKVLKAENKAIKEIATKINSDGYIELKENAVTQPIEFFSRNKQAFGLSSHDEMRLKRVEDDDIKKGKKHYRYVQFYKGIEVKGAEYLLHTDNKSLTHGKIVENLSLDITKTIKESKALTIALASVAAKKYAWEDVNYEREKRKDLKDSNATHYPKAELQFDLRPGMQELIKENYVLVYKFKIKTIQPDNFIEVWIDAINGKVLKKESLIHAGTFTPLYSVYGSSVSFSTRYRSLPYWDYVLQDNARNIITKNWKDGQAFALTSLVDHKGNNWGTSNQEATTSYWCVQQAWDYYKNVWGRAGMNGGNRNIRVWAKWPDTQFQAGYAQGDDVDYIWVGYSKTGNNRAEIDVIGHEFTHGITNYTAGLAKDGEPGALNESFSDIFGTMIERYVLGSNNWSIGEQAGTIRSLASPWIFGHPDFYQGFGWVNVNGCTPNDTNDKCGIHTNSGVQNHWFFLLSQRIGIESAARIAYRNLTRYLQPRSNYADARAGAIQAAIDIFGACSNEWVQTANTWNDVGVGERINEACLSSYIEGPYDLRYNNDWGTWTVHPSGGDGNYTYEWAVSYDNNIYYDLNNFSNSYTSTIHTRDMYLSVNIRSGNAQAVNNWIRVWCSDCDEIFEPDTRISPNPARDFVDVSIINKNSTISKNLIPKTQNISEIEYKLYDSFGMLLFQNLKGNISERINTSNLKNGIYTLTIKTGKDLLNRKIIIDK